MSAQTRSQLFRSSNIFGTNSAQHSVMVHFDYSCTDLLSVLRLEERVAAAVALVGVGECDGFTVDGEQGSLIMYGPDADRLFRVVQPILETCPFMRAARVSLRRGLPQHGMRERKFSLRITR